MSETKEKDHPLLPDQNKLSLMLENVKKEWNATYGDKSLKDADKIINTNANEYIDGASSEIGKVEETMLQLEACASRIQRLYNMSLGKEADAEDVFSNAMTYYSLNIEGKTEKEKEKKALCNETTLITLKEILGVRRKARIYLEKTADRIENYVSALKKSHTRRTGTKANSD